MTPTLSPKQREEVLEAAFTAYIGRIEARCGEPVIRSEVNDARLRDSLTAALDAALPAIIGAVLERAAALAEGLYEPSHNSSGTLLHRINAANMRGVEIARRIRALAEGAR